MKVKAEGKHDAHWGAVMGFDWMFETPSLLFNELDESELIETRDGIEFLQRTWGDFALKSFITKKRLISSTFTLTPLQPGHNLPLLEVRSWQSEVEGAITLEHPLCNPLRTYFNDFWKDSESLESGKDLSVGLSGFIYRLETDQSEPKLESLNSKEDDQTSYQFRGALLTDIEQKERFYHLGWTALLTLDHPIHPLNIRIWVHKKNCPIPPEEGVLYKGELWLQSSLLSKS